MSIDHDAYQETITEFQPETDTERSLALRIASLRAEARRCELHHSWGAADHRKQLAADLAEKLRDEQAKRHGTLAAKTKRKVDPAGAYRARMERYQAALAELRRTRTLTGYAHPQERADLASLLRRMAMTIARLRGGELSPKERSVETDKLAELENRVQALQRDHG